MSLPQVPNLAPAQFSNHNEQDIKALYDYLGRLVAQLEARLAALEAAP